MGGTGFRVSLDNGGTGFYPLGNGGELDSTPLVMEELDSTPIGKGGRGVKRAVLLIYRLCIIRKASGLGLYS